LVRLSAEDVMKVVEVRAREWPGFTTAAADAVIEETSGNIRRVMTVLYDLWSEPSTPTGVVTRDAVRLAAQRRLQPGSEVGIIPAIEAAMRAGGAIISRDETFGQPPEAVDAVARLGTDLRLIVKIIHARDELALINASETFARLVKEVRSSHPQARGLCVTLGAVITKHVLALDAAFPELDLVNGEEPGIVERLPEIVGRALALAPEASPPPAPFSLQELDYIRRAIVERAETQIVRSQEVFEKDSRSEAVRQTSVADPEELASQKAEIGRDAVYKDLMEEVRSNLSGRFFSGLLHSPSILGTIGLGLAVILFTRALITGDYYVHRSMSPYEELISLVTSVGALVLIVIGAFLAVRLYIDFREFQRFQIQTLRRLYGDGAPISVFVDANNMVERALLERGPRRGRAAAMAQGPKRAALSA
jgi:hypothetical protein